MRYGNGKLICLLAGLAAGANLYAITPEENEGGSRFSAITERNVFGLKAPPPPPDPSANIKVEPPKLKLQGISLILGKKQVLINVLPKPPTRPKAESLLMAEGERKDDIEVVSIDHIGEKVEFKIGGSPVTLTMKDDSERPVAGPAPAFPPPVAGAPGIVPPPGAIPNPAAAAPPGGGAVATTIGGRSALPARPLRTEVVGGGAPAGGVPGGAAVPGGNANPQGGPQLAPEANDVFVEAKKLNYQQTGDERARLLPRTGVPQPQ